MVRKPLYSILFVILYLQTAIAGNWLTNNAASEVTFGEVATIVSRGGSGYCLVQKEGSIFWSDNGNTWTQGVSYSGSNNRCKTGPKSRTSCPPIKELPLI